MKTRLAFLTFALVSAVSATAFAGGYDTPILYSARHMGMGGTAQGYVDDPSALFHNPAGLANVKNISVLGDFSLVLGTIKSNPSTLTRTNEPNPTSELTIAPFFLAGGAFRVHENVVLGVAVYPVASAGGEYLTNGVLNNLEDSTKLVFIEAAPGVAVNLPYGINLGASYRVTYASLDRKIASDAGTSVDLSVTGLNFASFRLGAQWKAIEEETPAAEWAYRRLSFGLMYRHKTSIDLTADKATVFFSPVRDASTTFILPSHLVVGTRGDWGRLGGAVNLEYGFNSQNDVSYIQGICDAPNGARLHGRHRQRFEGVLLERLRLEERHHPAHRPRVPVARRERPSHAHWLHLRRHDVLEGLSDRVQHAARSDALDHRGRGLQRRPLEGEPRVRVPLW
ncbi:MAG: hypothetical protein R3A78_06710 [Polyangiales bacterium]